ncbi:SurA N-terminal domain-containing protein [soil metagenome]
MTCRAELVRKGAALRVAVVAAVITLGLAGCGGPSLAGAAAVVGGERITTAELRASAERVLADQRAAGGGVSAGAELQRTVLSREIVSRTIDEGARREGVSVTDGEVSSWIEDLRAARGGREAVDALLVESDVARAELPRVARNNVTFRKLVDKLGEDRINGYLQDVSRDLGVRVNPRYGRWDVEQIGVIPSDSTLSRPARSTGDAGDAGLLPPTG